MHKMAAVRQSETAFFAQVTCAEVEQHVLCRKGGTCPTAAGSDMCASLQRSCADTSCSSDSGNARKVNGCLKAAISKRSPVNKQAVQIKPSCHSCFKTLCKVRQGLPFNSHPSDIGPGCHNGLDRSISVAASSDEAKLEMASRRATA